MRRLLLGLVLALTACGGAGSSATPTSPVAPQTVGVLADRSAPSPHASCPPSELGFPPAGAPTCPELVLKIVGGRTLTASDTRADGPDGSIALLFDANGNFLNAQQRGTPLRKHPTYELDVLDSANARAVATDEWTLVHQDTPSLAPFAVHLATVKQLSGNHVTVAASVLSYLVTDRAGNAVGTVVDTMGLPVDFTVPAETPLPLTLLTFTTGVPESHCGNCWVTLQH
ncbi:MAG TPA: hypothetical protein VMA36_09160 [Candidatus Limnocylindria bacterium]|jgi:hypothetical protein|nr:hypothetical protein [Candidatus Limnocylindria bacterium]